jgi:hypothetical protein
MLVFTIAGGVAVGTGVVLYVLGVSRDARAVSASVTRDSIGISASFSW